MANKAGFYKKYLITSDWYVWGSDCFVELRFNFLIVG
jgi:hypothetical protein